MLQKNRLTWILFILLIGLSICSLFIGVIDIDIKDLWNFSDVTTMKLFFLSRIPRLLAILCTGMGMSMAGLIMQQLCMNKFVSPSTGATISSAQFGILLSMVFFPTLGLWCRVSLAFMMALLGTFIFVWVLQKIQFKNSVLVPLVGIMFGNVLGGITSFIAYKYEVTQQLSSYLVGSFSLIMKGNYELVWLVLPLGVIAYIYARYFNIVGMGKDFAQNLGVNYKWILCLGLGICAMISASIVSIVGQISYIGLIIPNIISILKGDHIKGTLIDTALLGALFVLVCDIFARTMMLPYELPIEFIVGMLGSLIFIGMLIYKLKHGHKKIQKGERYEVKLTKKKAKYS